VSAQHCGRRRRLVSSFFLNCFVVASVLVVDIRFITGISFVAAVNFSLAAIFHEEIDQALHSVVLGAVDD
jgi:hypothetical protein